MCTLQADPKLLTIQHTTAQIACSHSQISQSSDYSWLPRAVPQALGPPRVTCMPCCCCRPVLGVTTACLSSHHVLLTRLHTDTVMAYTCGPTDCIASQPHPPHRTTLSPVVVLTTSPPVTLPLPTCYSSPSCSLGRLSHTISTSA